MASFKCKKCNAKNSVQNEWVEEGISRLVHCHSCGHKMNLKLKPGKRNSRSQSPKGTVVLTKDKLEKPSLGFRISSNSKKYFYPIPEKNTSFNIYFGRNPSQSDAADQDELLFIDDPYVSRFHGVISIIKKNGEIKMSIQDNESSNGIFINDNRLENGDIVLLLPKDRMTFGNTTLQIEDQ